MSDAAPRHHVYFSPGMFGFGRLGSYNYFAHVERELASRFAAAGQRLVAHMLDELPTASIRRRSIRLAEVVERTALPGDAIHLLGHSTGGVDARLVASPTTRTIPVASLTWLPRLRSVTTMNTPHYGTPLASFFATSDGQRVLAALSMLTVAGLSLGEQPLRASGVILGFLRQGGLAVPFKLLMLERAIESMVGMVDDALCPEVRTFLSAIQDDQGSMLQLCPEAMDLVGAGIDDRPGVRYQATVSMSPRPTPRRWAEMLGQPLRALSLSLFFGLHHLSSRAGERYPCAAPDGTPSATGPACEDVLLRAFGRAPTLEDNDGVVPLRSQLWGNVVWAGLGDHLDVLGHFRDDRTDAPADQLHRDWLTSGSAFTHAKFASLMDAVATGMLA
jgi:triacylglycerol lipase